MIIPNFPKELEELHHAWHDPTAHPGLPTRKSAIGTDDGGREFLVFHRDFIAKVHQWYATQPNADPNLLAPSWIEIPTELKNRNLTMRDENGNLIDISWNDSLANAQERAIHASHVGEFRLLGKFGTFIELNLHGWLHSASSVVYNEPIVASLHSPNSTWFYKIHGLVQFWWDLWNLGNTVRFINPEIQKVLNPDIQKVLNSFILLNPK